MGVRNYLVEGVSGSGKTTVATELERRGIHVVHGDRALAYQGDPRTGVPTEGLRHENHIWDVAKVRAIIADRSRPVTFFCGGSRNYRDFLALFDAVFVLQLDVETLTRRLLVRPDDEFGANPREREFVLRLHRTEEDIPPGGERIDATRPVSEVVDEILRRTGESG